MTNFNFFFLIIPRACGPADRRSRGINHSARWRSEFWGGASAGRLPETLMSHLSGRAARHATPRPLRGAGVWKCLGEAECDRVGSGWRLDSSCRCLVCDVLRRSAVVSPRRTSLVSFDHACGQLISIRGHQGGAFTAIHAPPRRVTSLSSGSAEVSRGRGNTSGRPGHRLGIASSASGPPLGHPHIAISRSSGWPGDAGMHRRGGATGSTVFKRRHQSSGDSQPFSFREGLATFTVRT